jgi:hypothetical protein
VGPFCVDGAGRDGSAVRPDTVSPLGGRGTQNPNALRSLGVAFGLVAAGLVVLATFTARLSCPTIDLDHNRLIDRGEGLFFLICAGVMIIGAIASIRDRRVGWLLVLAGLAILGLTIYSATGSRSLVLAAVPGIEGAVHGELGPGLGLSGIAGVLAAIGGGLIVSPTR